MNVQKRLNFLVGIMALLLCCCCSCHEEYHSNESKHTVVLTSYFDKSVREAVKEDPSTRINAVYLDLETGDEENNQYADIFYQLSCGSDCFPLISLTENAGVPLFSTDHEPEKTECKELLNQEGNMPHHLITIQPGEYSCIQTVEGAIGWIHIDDTFRYGMEKGEIQITYWLWEDD